MTIRSILRSIDARLARLERQSQVGKCCPQDGQGNQIPVLIPREQPQPLPSSGDGRCRRIARLLQRSVISYNELVETVKSNDYTSGVLNASAIIEALLFNLTGAVLPYLTQANALRFIESILDESLETLKIVGPLDLCRAARAYSNGDDPVAILTEGSSPAAALAYSIFFQATGGISWGERFSDDDLPPADVPDSCCFPDFFQLVPAATNLVCGNSTYSIEAIASTIPEVTGVIVAPGVVSRTLISGRYLQQVANPGRFNLWVWFSASPDLNESCRNPDFEFGVGTSWRVQETGPPYIVIRNRAAYEGTYLTCTREPQFPDNVSVL